MPARIRDEIIHKGINEIIQETGLSAGQHWAYTNNKKRRNLYQLANSRKVKGKPFFGHGTWEKYLEKKHRVVPVDQRTWSNKRLHRTIATLIEQYPIEEVSWTRKNKTIIHGKSLKGLYEQAFFSNRNRDLNLRKFFGRGTWANYVAWVRQKYRNV